MRARHSIAFYIFLTLIFLAGLILLFLRQPFINFFREQSGVTAVDVTPRKSLPTDQLLNTGILESEKLSSLRENVKVFSMEDVCGDSVNAPKRCTVGNINPFSNK